MEMSGHFLFSSSDAVWFSGQEKFIVWKCGYFLAEIINLYNW